MACIFPKTMTNYSKRMAQLSRRIFGEVSRPTANQSLKVVKKFSEVPDDLNPAIVNYYPNHPQFTVLMRVLREHGLYRDEHLDFVEEMERLRVLRGKGKKPKPEKKDRKVKGKK